MSVDIKVIYEEQMTQALKSGDLSFHAKQQGEIWREYTIFQKKPTDEEYLVSWCIAWVVELETKHNFTCLYLNKFWQDNAQLPENFAGFKSFFQKLDANFKMQRLIDALKNSEMVHFIELNSPIEPAVERALKPLVLTQYQGQFKFYYARVFDNELAIKKTLHKRGGKRKSLPKKEQEKFNNLVQILFKTDSNTSSINQADLIDKDQEPDWQKIAVAQMFSSNFGIITGGPGVGKTTTVVRLIAALQIWNFYTKRKGLKIILGAPTGKAAARLSESILNQLKDKKFGLPDLKKVAQKLDEKLYKNFENVGISEWSQILPIEVQTVHKILQARILGIANRAEKLSLDVLIIDEASMLNLSLFGTLLQVLPLNSRLFLLGDENQLSSVESGSVLSDLCALNSGLYTQAEKNELFALTGETINNAFINTNSTDGNSNQVDTKNNANKGQILQITKLRKSYRFDENKGVGKLAKIVNESGEPINSDAQKSNAQTTKSATQTLNELTECFANNEKNLQLHKIDDGKAFDKKIKELAETGWKDYFELLTNKIPSTDAEKQVWDQWSKEVFAAFNKFQFLVVARQDEFGFDKVNEILDEYFSERFKQDEDFSQRFTQLGKAKQLGRPYIVTKNDSVLGINNGDLCLFLPYKDKMQLHFLANNSDDAEQEDRENTKDSKQGATDIKRIAKSKIDNLESGWSLTVHKSQGSEFEKVCLIIPSKNSPLLSKEIFYTGLTRAKENFSLIYKDEEQIKSTLSKKIQRWSGFDN